MARITPQTNRIDTFAAANGISEGDVVRWNMDYFNGNPTFWLPLGRDFNTEAPLSRAGLRLTVGDGEQSLLVVDGEYLIIRQV